MKTQIGMFVLGLAVQTLLVSADSSNVLSLDSFNFDEGIENNPLVLVNCMLIPHSSTGCEMADIS